MASWDTSWNERYQRGEHCQTSPHPLLERVARLRPAGRALDLACGLGRHALLLAAHGWRVTAVDSSVVALDLLHTKAKEQGLQVDTQLANLERHEFLISPDEYALIVTTCYLQRDLFPAIRAGVQPGGLFAGVIALEDDDPDVKPMNPAFLLEAGELRAQFADWELLHDLERKEKGRRALAELLTRRPL